LLGATSVNTYGVRPGAFVVWGSDSLRLGHCDNPFDLFEVDSDLVAVLSTLSATAGSENQGGQLGEGVKKLDRLMGRLIAAGILVESRELATRKNAGFRSPDVEATRAAQAYPDLRVID
jgi:hypothetical protein